MSECEICGKEFKDDEEPWKVESVEDGEVDDYFRAHEDCLGKRRIRMLEMLSKLWS